MLLQHATALRQYLYEVPDTPDKEKLPDIVRLFRLRLLPALLHCILYHVHQAVQLYERKLLFYRDLRQHRI